MTDWNIGTDYLRRKLGAVARALAIEVGVPDPEHVCRCVVGDDQGRTTFHYDDRRDPWVLPGMVKVER